VEAFGFLLDLELRGRSCCRRPRQICAIILVVVALGIELSSGIAGPNSFDEEDMSDAHDLLSLNFRQDTTSRSLALTLRGKLEKE
jgi:hypothetical protein